MEYQVGDMVVFTNEFGQERVGRVITLNAYDQQGILGMTGTYGCYCRRPEEVRHAEHWEVHIAEFNNGLLK